jgi:hypothetical protein
LNKLSQGSKKKNDVEIPCAIKDTDGNENQMSMTKMTVIGIPEIPRQRSNSSAQTWLIDH